ncbi:MAG: glycosyltransferase [Candidatus Sumerlaeaceae bacterium]|nr:glycosyltransferase [Candidatus Sumerlaeaceae bacterium]
MTRPLKTPAERVRDVFLAPLHAALFLWLMVYVPVRTALMWLLLWAVGHRPVREAASGEFDVICISHVPWRHIWQRNHHTMTRLARTRRVVYLQQFGPAYIHVFARWAPGIFRDWAARHELVFVRLPLLYPGESRFSWVMRLNRWIMGTHLRWLEWQLGLRNTVLWFYYPGTAYVLDVFEPAAVVYDIQDEYSAFYWAPRDIARREQMLLERADVLFAGTHALYLKKVSPSGAPSHFFPCGVEFDHFHAAAPGVSASLAEPKELRKIGRPRLVYMGLIDARIDGDLLAEVCARRPDWQVVMIGPVDRGNFDADGLTARFENIHFLGKMDYARLPAFLAHCDVCLMPWKINELTLHINPTKTLEYLATCRPVVSISLPDLEAFFGPAVALAPDADRFIALCDDALAGRLADRVQRGLAMAHAYSWDTVVGQMEGYVREAMLRRAGLAPSGRAGEDRPYEAASPARPAAYQLYTSSGGSHWTWCPPEARPRHRIWRLFQAALALVLLPVALCVMATVVLLQPGLALLDRIRRKTS